MSFHVYRLGNATRFALVALAFLAAVGSAAGQATPITVKASLGQKLGWMPDGWGNYKFLLSNSSGSEAKLVSWTAHWEAKGKVVGDPWGGPLDQSISPGKTMDRGEVGSLPVSVFDAAKPEAPKIVGEFVAEQAGKQFHVPFSLAVPGAFLAEPLKLIKGKTVGLNLMESRYRTFKQLKRTLNWVDECYEAMIDLTGEHPFGGKLMVFKECPPHPYWAYAGQEMILNTDYVGTTLKEFDDGLISFGWVHEVGHNFDVLGDWYIWSGPAAEWQANFKLSYALESIPDQTFRIKWSFQAPDYPAPDKSIRLTGHELVEKFFVMFGDGYLSDPNRDWLSLSSDEMHTFFQRLQREYGWDIFKAWYRTYRRLADAKMPMPATPTEKINLIAAILSHEAKVDLTPVFARWRFPVTGASMKASADKYGIGGP